MIAKLKTIAIAAGVFVVSLVLAFWRGRASGAASVKAKAQQEDIANAHDIQARADAARAEPIGDPVERLRETGQLRD